MQQTNGPVVVGIGEILWDLLPEGKRVGGAPANFAYHAASLGAEGLAVSSVGDDAEGAELLGRITASGVDRRYIGVNPAHPTSTVSVSLNEKGEARYVIHENVAWDYLAFTPALAELAVKTDAVCVGTLAQRSPVTRQTIHRFLESTPRASLRIFDINLRQNYFDREGIERTLRQCNVVKLNDDEWPVVAALLGIPTDWESGLETLRSRFSLRVIALTRGGNGSVLCTSEGHDTIQGIPVKVVDTVGAGDAFTAALAVGLLQGAPLLQVHQHAARVAAYVCTQPGATPSLPAELRSIEGRGD